GLTQEELAGKAGVSTRAISDLERGVKTRPRPFTARQLAAALQLSAPDRVAFLERARGIAPGSPPDGAADSRQPVAARHLVTGGFLGSLPAGPLVARTEEMARILPSIDAVASGEGRLVVLSGEPGVGKTRLAQEVTVEVRDRGFLLAAGRCYEPQQTVPFYPFLDLLATLHGAAPPAIQGEASRHWPYLARLLPDQLGLRHLPPSDHPDDQWRLFQAVTSFVTAVAEMCPVALLLDDLHWADSASIDVLAHLARHTRDCRLLLVGTVRDVEASFHPSLRGALYDLGREDLLQSIPIRRFGVDGTAALMAATMDETAIPDELARLVHGRTDGNAFFVQQVARDLLERGAVSDGEIGRARRMGDMPESVRAAIGYRLSRLEERTREILHEASVLGQAFSFDDLHATGCRAEEVLEAALEEACMAGLARESAPETYAFDHVLTQQALYEGLSSRRRRKLHLAAGEALERSSVVGAHLPVSSAGRQERRAAELAWHFRHGNDTERALAWTMRAGEQAEAVFAYQEAERQYRTALDLAQGLTDRAIEAQAWETLGRVLKSLARYDEALTALETSAAMYRRQGDAEGEGRVAAGVGLIHALRGAPDEGTARIQATLDTLEPSGPSSSLPGLYAALVRLYDAAGQHDAELVAAERAVESASAVQDSRVLAQANVALGDARAPPVRRGAGGAAG
ncbi:MAG: AAA family ATPase, partial [Chloroflexi bacterium]|nr:AAA family ATPase [Chloroflexota bacterium]